ncbi:MAG: proteasome non-ATPase regulatory subunit 10-like [Pedosphaera sp.]|nr:proteasome non-ATPase regulatory subunit 10-like [Pedosphaera sp.]
MIPKKKLTEDAARKIGAYWRAVGKGDAKTVEALLQEGMDPNQRVWMESMLTLAARKKRTGVIKVLLKAGADPNIQRGGPLILAIGTRNHEAVQALIAAGANANLRGPGDFPPLTQACFGRDAELVEMLVRAGANLNKRSEVKLSGTRGSTEAPPLIIAVWEGHADVVKVLLKAGANPSAKDSSGRTVLDWARVSRKPGARQILSLLQQGSGNNLKTGPAIRLQPDFTVAAGRQEFRQALSELKALTHKSPHPLHAEDGTSVAGGFFFVVPEEKAASLLVTKHQRRFLAQDCFLFWTEGQTKVGESAVGILPTADVFEAIAAIQTNGANYKVSNEEIIVRMRRLSSKHPFTLAGVGFDFIAGRPSSPLEEAGKLANWFSKFCPDVGDKEALAKQLKQTGDFFLWWD